MNLFVIVFNGTVIYGPVLWNKVLFETVILEDARLTVVLPARNTEPYTHSQNLKILPVESGISQSYNPIVQIAHGPIWTFYEDKAVSSYEAVYKPIEAIRTEFIKMASAARYKKQILGVTIQLNGNSYVVETKGNAVDQLTRKLNSSQEVIVWKFNDGQWAHLTKVNIQSIITALDDYEQSCFDWEFELINEINTIVSTKTEILARADLLNLITQYPELNNI